MNKTKLDLWDDKVIYGLNVPFWPVALHFHLDVYKEDAMFIEVIKQDPVFDKIERGG